MFERFFRSKAARAAGEALFAAAAEQARQPALFTTMGAPDTVEGRFEMTVVHVWLVMRRLKNGDARTRDVAQSLFDVMFSSFDDALRELGVGDLIVGKKIRKMAENFYGRVKAYDTAMTEPTQDAMQQALAAALARNVYETADAQAAHALAEYALAAAEDVDAQPLDAILRGEISFAGPNL